MQPWRMVVNMGGHGSDSFGGFGHAGMSSVQRMIAKCTESAATATAACLQLAKDGHELSGSAGAAVSGGIRCMPLRLSCAGDSFVKLLWIVCVGWSARGGAGRCCQYSAPVGIYSRCARTRDL